MDSASLAGGNNDGYTECGLRTYSFRYSPLTSGTLVTATDQETFEIEARSPDLRVGTYTVSVTVELQNDPSKSINR